MKLVMTESLKKTVGRVDPSSSEARRHLTCQQTLKLLTRFMVVFALAYVNLSYATCGQPGQPNGSCCCSNNDCESKQCGQSQQGVYCGNETPAGYCYSGSNAPLTYTPSTPTYIVPYGRGRSGGVGGARGPR